MLDVGMVGGMPAFLFLAEDAASSVPSDHLARGAGGDEGHPSGSVILTTCLQWKTGILGLVIFYLT